MDSELKKKMQLLDPGYVVPQSERVQNRKPVDFRSEPLRVNNVGLEIKEDSPVNAAMQKLYMDRMMQAGAVDNLESHEQADRDFYAEPIRAQMIKDLGVHMRGGVPELTPEQEADLMAGENAKVKLNSRQQMINDLMTDAKPVGELEALYKLKGR